MRKDARLDELSSSEHTFTEKKASFESNEVKNEPWYKKLREKKPIDRNNDRSSSNK